jgi:hypothetical protein
MPEGCEDSLSRRLRDEWGGITRIWRNRHSEPEYVRDQIKRHGSNTTTHVLSTRQQARTFLAALSTHSA